jgi:hypothetical protein
LEYDHDQQLDEWLWSSSISALIAEKKFFIFLFIF